MLRVVITVSVFLLMLAVPDNAHAAKKMPTACRAAAAHLVHKPLAEAARLRLAQCLTAHGAQQRAVEHWLRVLRSAFWGHNVVVLQQAIPVLLRYNQLPAVLHAVQQPLASLQSARSSGLLDIDVSGWSNGRREQFADLLWTLARAVSRQQHDALLRPILTKLYVQLAETSASQRALADALSLPWQQQLTIAQRLQRAKVLVKRHHHASAEKLLHTLRLPLGLQPSAFTCEVNYLLGKLARQQRQYSKALQILAKLDGCAQPFARNAAYLRLRILSFRPSVAKLPQFDAFVQRYPQHAFSDDVLWWKAGVLLQLNKLEQADATLMRLVQEFPGGDMVPRARFAAAFEQARAGQHDRAVQRFTAIRRNKKASQLRRDQATYWLGRLLLYPDVMQLRPSQLAKSRQRGAQLLATLAQQRPTTYHGYLARRMLQHAQAAGHATATKRFQPPMEIILANVVPKPPKEVLHNSKLLQLQRWIAAGYGEQASLLLQSFSDSMARRHLKGRGDWLWAAYLSHRAGQLYKSHQLMRAWGKGYPAGALNQNSLLLWQLLHPNAYADIMRTAADSRGLPVELLQAIAWQESMLDAQVISWAGAAGLFQFIEPTAKQVAQSIGLPPPTLQQLLNPQLSARLAANHFMDLMGQLWHPALAVAAYNRGEPALRRWLKRWPAAAPLDAFVAAIPTDQTRHYVWCVVGAWVAYHTLKGNSSPLYFPLTLPDTTNRASLAGR
ncbi:MAG: transglycosylase SLT domain-containing protein [Myxococcota bacterium]